MTWSTPTLFEVNMSAEIGAYQDDTGERHPGAASREPDWRADRPRPGSEPSRVEANR